MKMRKRTDLKERFEDHIAKAARKLIEEFQRLPIVGRYKKRGTAQILADKYGITLRALQNIVYGQNWKHIHAQAS